MLTSDFFSGDDPTAAVSYRLQMAGADLEYFPNFVAPDIADQWFVSLMREGAVSWRQDSMMMYGRKVLIPRLNAWYGEPGLDYMYSGIPMNPEPWSSVLLEIKSQVNTTAAHSFTSALINLYRDHNDSVAWHADDEPELGQQPVIASLSLGAEREFQMRHRNYRGNGIKTHKMVLGTGSLLVMRGDTQKNWLHQVPKRSAAAVTGPRINITFRKIFSA